MYTACLHRDPSVRQIQAVKLAPIDLRPPPKCGSLSRVANMSWAVEYVQEGALFLVFSSEPCEHRRA